MSIKGDVVENWRDFETSWDYYTIATDLRSKETTDAGKEIVAATLCTVMGPESKKIMNSLPSLTDADKKNPKRIIEELRKYFVPQRNVLYERFVFNSATQKPSETVDEYVVRLRQLANSCEFGDLKDSLIRDRIVIGTSDENGRERLLRECPVPNLDKVVESLRAAEISRTHKQVISGKQDAGQVETIHYTDKRNKRTNQKKGKGSQSSGQPKPQKQTQDRRPAHKSQNPSQSCHWCGKKADHNKKGCPAKDVQCHNCGKTGHFAVVCRSNKQVHEVNEEDVSYPEDYYLHDCYFMGELNDTNDDFWSAEVLIDNRPCTLKLDSGSKVTVIGENTPWLRAKRLDKVTSVFRGPGGVNLSHLIKGQITNALFAVGGNTHRENVYVMKNQSKNLLSKSAIQALHLLIPSAAVHNVETAPNFKAEFPELFKGLGLMKEKYKIPLKSDAVSVCLYTPRRVPHPLLPKVKEKLLSMVNQKVISPVNDPTDWCSGMVIAPKRNGDVRICVDLTPLNKAVKREVHPMASVDENLAKLKDSKVFTKLDANSGFWQIPLDEESRLLTTFVTPFGRYCFNRLPFGISSAPEIFQRAMSRILEGLDGTVCHMDDILIHGETQELHDSRVRKVLQRLKDAGVTLNDKCEFSKQRMKFLGHVISENGVEADPEKTKAIREFPRPTTVTELQRFHGMVNQLAKFLPNLATINEPLRQLLKKGQQWLNRCHTCAKLRPERREPLMALSFPSLPWSRIGTDLFELDQTDYLIVVDYASRWFEIRKLRSTTSAAVTRHMCEIFALHGIPDTVVSDNGPQYISQEFADFAKDMGFTHITSSPLYPQANGEVERAVQTAKNILRKNANPHLGLLAYRSAPLANGLTPSEILMGRRLRNKLPLVPENLRPRKIDQEKLQKKEQEYRERYSDNYNTRHRAVELPTLQQGDKVFIRDQARYGEVEKKLESPRSYQLVTETGSVIRRNRRALVHKPEVQSEESSVVPSPPDQPPAHEGREGSPGLAASPSPTPSKVAVRKSGRLTKAPNNPDMIYY